MLNGDIIFFKFYAKVGLTGSKKKLFLKKRNNVYVDFWIADFLFGKISRSNIANVSHSTMILFYTFFVAIPFFAKRNKITLFQKMDFF